MAGCRGKGLVPRKTIVLFAVMIPTSIKLLLLLHSANGDLIILQPTKAIDFAFYQR
jgi:hypothetical protein